MIGFIVRYTISKVLCEEDGTYKDDCFVPEMITEHFCADFNDALKEYGEHLKTHKNQAWYPGYIHDSENNKVFFRIVHEGRYNWYVYKTVLQIEQCFYDKKDAG